ncbi:elongation factor 4 [Striga asiatica]|uniref:Elongation factor 4 n=1 Tax=Striga asiatica TaxID=4170 RepID=A0A5A7PMT9_STRAF|nr:elongation factor 4 [Striga asiatica]
MISVKQNVNNVAMVSQDMDDGNGVGQVALSVSAHFSSVGTATLLGSAVKDNVLLKTWQPLVIAESVVPPIFWAHITASPNTSRGLARAIAALAERQQATIETPTTTAATEKRRITTLQRGHCGVSWPLTRVCMCKTKCIFIPAEQS